MKTKKVKEKVEKLPDGRYSISLNLGTEYFLGTGESVLDALKSINKPIKITTKGFLTITDGEKKAEMVLTIPRAKRLFYPLAQTYLAKQLDLLMR